MTIPVENPELNDRSSKLARPNVLARRVKFIHERINRDSYACGTLRRQWHFANHVETDLERRPNRKNGNFERDSRRKLARQNLELACLATTSDPLQTIRPVVMGNTPDSDLFKILITVKKDWRKHPLPEWDDLSRPERWAFGVVSYLGLSRGEYSAITLNFSEEKARRPFEHLKDSARKKLPEILGLGVPFTLERDKKGRPHLHTFTPGNVTDAQRAALKKMGGNWNGKDSKRQLVIKRRYGPQDAIAWAAGYMVKDVVKGEAIYHAPHNMTREGKANYERVTAIVREQCITVRNSQTTSPTQTKVLEKTAPCSSPCENVSTTILKIEANSHTATPGHAQEGQQNALESISHQKAHQDSQNTNKAPKSDSVSFGDVEGQQVHQPRLPVDSAPDAIRQVGGHSLRIGGDAKES